MTARPAAQVPIGLPAASSIAEVRPWTWLTGLIPPHAAALTHGGPLNRIDYTFGVTELTERAVVSRVPGLIDERLKVLSRRDPLTVRPGTSLQTCLDLIRETGIADSVFVTDEAGRLLGV